MSLDRTNSSGFTLLEVLVALGILAIALEVTMAAIEPAGRRVGADASARAATMYAQSLVARIGADIPVADGRLDGHDHALDWTVIITPWENLDIERPRAFRVPMTPHLVAVTVSWPPHSRNDTVSINTLRLVRNR